jgi:hypothetical protein
MKQSGDARQNQSYIPRPLGNYDRQDPLPKGLPNPNLGQGLKASASLRNKYVTRIFLPKKKARFDSRAF